jgi:hypothetical protein
MIIHWQIGPIGSPAEGTVVRPNLGAPGRPNTGGQFQVGGPVKPGMKVHVLAIPEAGKTDGFNACRIFFNGEKVDEDPRANGPVECNFIVRG